MLLFELTPTIWQSAFVSLVIGLTLFVDVPMLNRLKRFTSATGRLSVFRATTVYWWIFAFLALALASPNDLFVVRQANADMEWLLGSPVALGISITVLIVFFSLGLGPGLHCAMRPEARQKYSSAMHTLHHMLPVSESERRWWVLVSITAGVCEEVFFRGFVPQFLQGQLHGGWTMNQTSAWLLSALAFGCCHFYQGVGGVARTTLGGLMFGLLAVVTGNLVLPIVLHVLVDLAVLWVYRPQLDTPATAARLVHGCSPALVSEA